MEETMNLSHSLAYDQLITYVWFSNKREQFQIRSKPRLSVGRKICIEHSFAIDKDRVIE